MARLGIPPSRKTHNLRRLSPSHFLLLACRDLSENKIAELPPEAVTGLLSLTRIDLHTNEIERLPPELFRLTNISQM